MAYQPFYQVPIALTLFGLLRVDNGDVATYQRAADREADVLGERRVPGRRFPVRAASKRAASPSKAGVGPFQRN